MKRFLLLAAACAVSCSLSANPTSTSVFYDFSQQNDFWTFFGGWKLRNNGVGGSTAAWGFDVIEDDFLASPAVNLRTGTEYTITFRADGSGTPKRLGMAVNTSPKLGADTLIAPNIAGDEDFQTLFSVTFTPMSTTNHHLVFFVNGGTGFRKLVVDDITISGAELNEAPLTTFEYPGNTSTSLISGANFTFSADAVDNDGSVDFVEFIVDGNVVEIDFDAPYSATYTVAGSGTQEFSARAQDNEGVQSVTSSFSLDVIEGDRISSYLGGGGSDDVRGVVFLSDGTVAMAANLSEYPTGIVPILLNGTTNGDAGVILRLNAEATEILSLAVVSTSVGDLSVDDQDRLYVAAGASGLLRLTDLGTTVDYAVDLPQITHRVDASPGGHVVVLRDDQTNYDQSQLLDARIHLFDPSGVELFETSGATTFTTDVAVDEVSQTFYSTGFKNFRTLGEPGGTVFPVDVPAIKADAFDGSVRWRAYDWSSDSTSNRWLNLPTNNMADTRGTRIEIGDDGQLYALFEADGGNHCLRYDPFEITTRIAIVGGDQFSEFFNSRTEPKTFVGRYDPMTGDYLLGQQFCARLSNGAANTVKNRYGGLAATETGEVYVVGASASGIPLTEEVFPGGYQGGAFLLKLMPDFATREIVTRLTRGESHAVAAGPDGAYAFAGRTEEIFFTANALQETSGGGREGWYAVQPVQAALAVDWGYFQATPIGKGDVRLDWTLTTTAGHQSLRVERSRAGNEFASISPELPAGTQSFMDNQAKEAGRYYYRLRQVELDGKVSYSGIRQIDVEGAAFQVVPNPAADFIQVPGMSAPTYYYIMNAQGQRLLTGIVRSGNDRVEVTSLSVGLYYLVLEGRGVAFVVR